MGRSSGSVPAHREPNPASVRLTGVGRLVTIVVLAVLAGACGGGTSVSEPSSVPAATASPPDCADVATIEPSVVGDLPSTANPDEVVMGVLLTYAAEHPDTYGGLWIDRDHGGTIVLAFTDDPSAHRAAILARSPSPDDIPTVEPRPEITDDRPLGERDDVAIDVVQVPLSEVELRSLQREVSNHGDDLEIVGTGSRPDRGVVEVTVVDPTPEQLATLAAAFPTDALCVDVLRTPERPTDGLDVIPLPGTDDLVVECGARFPLSALTEPVPLEESDHPAAVALRAALADDGAGEMAFLPDDGWIVLSVDEETAVFGRFGDEVATAALSRGAGGWFVDGFGSGPCDLRVALPEGLGVVEWVVDPDAPDPGPDTTEIRVLVTERACAGGQEMGDRLLGPQVVETDEAVLIAFAAVPVVGGATCPSNPATAVTVRLAEPLGDRELRDGLAVDVTFGG